jgi:anti-anti-sigma regulatory factor
MSTTGHPDGHAAAQCCCENPREAAAVRGSGFTETVDPRSGCIRASGHLDTRAADMLSGTVAGLRRGGCTSVVLDLGGVQAADDAGLHAVRCLEAEVAATGGRMTLLNWPGRRTK